MPDKNQLIDVIKKGNDKIDKRLILKKDGRFEIIPYQCEQDIEQFSKLDYVTRWETWDAGNDLVGVAASKDDKLIDYTYRWAENAWEKFQKTGRTKITNFSS